MGACVRACVCACVVCVFDSLFIPLYAKLHTVYFGLHNYSLSKLEHCTPFIINRPLGLHISTRTLDYNTFIMHIYCIMLK